MWYKQVAYSGLNIQSTTGVYITANEKKMRDKEMEGGIGTGEASRKP